MSIVDLVNGACKELYNQGETRKKPQEIIAELMKCEPIKNGNLRKDVIQQASQTTGSTTTFQLLEDLYLNKEFTNPDQVECRNFHYDALLMICINAIRFNRTVGILTNENLTRAEYNTLAQEVSALSDHTKKNFPENIAIRFAIFESLIKTHFPIMFKDSKTKLEANTEFKFMETIIDLCKSSKITQEQAVKILSGEVSINFDNEGNLSFNSEISGTNHKTGLKDIKKFVDFYKSYPEETINVIVAIKSSIITPTPTPQNNNSTSNRSRGIISSMFACCSAKAVTEQVISNTSHQPEETKEEEAENNRISRRP